MTSSSVFPGFLAMVMLAQSWHASNAAACSQAASPQVGDEAPVFLARPTGIHSYVDPELGLVLTEYTAITVECLSGLCAASTTVVVVGGEVGDLVTRVAGKKHLVPSSQQLLVFRESKLGRAHPVDSRGLSLAQRRLLSVSEHRAKIAEFYLERARN